MRRWRFQRFAPINDVVRETVAPRRFQMWVVLSFGLVAQMLAILGIYSIVSYSVIQQTSEIGVGSAWP